MSSLQFGVQLKLNLTFGPAGFECQTQTGARGRAAPRILPLSGEGECHLGVCDMTRPPPPPLSLSLSLGAFRFNGPLGRGSPF